MFSYVYLRPKLSYLELLRYILVGFGHLDKTGVVTIVYAIE